ncbi:MAG: hypothetical protein PHC64_06880 [Candidatus Gastranaerophilales bacterium]|nr:hypothetical protein [Candidatus Gastranaerophilales bacterium]
MSEEFHTFEESLKEFLTEEQSDSYSSRNANFYKYNNLRIYMDPKKNKTPHFIIRIGISEAIYSISQGEKISGSLGPDERAIRRWLDRYFTRMDFLSLTWKKNMKPKPVTMRDDLDD